MRSVGTFEPLEQRTLLTAGGIELGPQTGFYDHPYVEVELFSGSTGLGPYDSGLGIFPYNYMLLDTGANSILIVSDAAAELESNGYETQGRYRELGIGGDTEFDLSLPYRLDFWGTDNVTHTLPQTADDVRILSEADVHLGGQSAFEGGLPGLVGMPAMAGRVTTLDLSEWAEIEDLFDIQPMGVTFAEGPDALPAAGGHRYSVGVDDRISFDPRDGLPPDAPVPVWAPVPFMTAVVEHHGNAEAADFLLDTGAEISLISERVAFAAGLDENGDGSLLDDAIYTVEISGIGGTIRAPVMLVEKLRLPTEQGTDLVWKAPNTYDFGVQITESDGSTEVGESGGFDTYEVVLTAEPEADVTITLDSLGGQVVAVDNAQPAHDFLEFDASNWDSPQTIRVTAVDDFSVEGPHRGAVRLLVSSTDAVFDGAPLANLTIAITDNDTAGPGVRVTRADYPTEISENEGTLTYEIVLTAPPTADVTITLDSLDGQLLAVDDADPANHFLTFTASGWNTPQVVRVTAVDDELVEGDHNGTISHTAASADPGYDGIAVGCVTPKVRDNEGGVELLVLDVAQGIDGIFGVDLLTSGMDFAFSLDPPGFPAVGATYFEKVHFDFREMFDGHGTVYFDLTPTYDHRVAITQGGGSTEVAEGGPFDTYEVVLRSEPTADVTIALRCVDGQVAAVDEANPGNDFLVFTQSNWSTPQVVRVAAINDERVEGRHTGTVAHIASSADLDYNGTTIDDVTAGIVDDDWAEVTGRHVFYNHSAFDGNDADANVRDDDAIAPDKVALLPGQSATSANYTSYSRGINGVMVDVDRLPDGVTLDTDDFRFRVGNSDDPAAWAPAPAPSSITVRPGDGDGGSDRVTILWDQRAIQKQWLQVTVLASDRTRLAEDDVFYFGNAIGESGNSATDAKVNATDMLAARNHQRTFIDPAPIDFDYDFDRDARVNANDMLIARNNQTSFLDALKLIAVPQSQPAGQVGVSQEVSASDAVLKQAAGRHAAPANWTWVYELEPIHAHRQSPEKDHLLTEAVDHLLTAPFEGSDLD